jgi:hypothetical protein
MVKRTEKNFSSSSALVISISTWREVLESMKIGAQGGKYRAVKLFLVSFSMVLIVFDSGGE